VLTGSLGSQSLAFSDLFTGPARAWSFGLSLLQPLINANRNRYQVDAQRDLFDAELQLVLAYRNNLVKALGGGWSGLSPDESDASHMSQASDVRTEKGEQRRNLAYRSD
jgi:multidrug efflux system outer membrane protein